MLDTSCEAAYLSEGQMYAGKRPSGGAGVCFQKHSKRPTSPLKGELPTVEVSPWPLIRRCICALLCLAPVATARPESKIAVLQDPLTSALSTWLHRTRAGPIVLGVLPDDATVTPPPKKCASRVLPATPSKCVTCVPAGRTEPACDTTPRPFPSRPRLCALLPPPNASSQRRCVLSTCSPPILLPTFETTRARESAYAAHSSSRSHGEPTV